MHLILGSSSAGHTAKRGLLATASALVLMLAWTTAARADSFTE